MSIEGEKGEFKSTEEASAAAEFEQKDKTESGDETLEQQKAEIDKSLTEYKKRVIFDKETERSRGPIEGPRPSYIELEGAQGVVAGEISTNRQDLLRKYMMDGIFEID